MEKRYDNEEELFTCALALPSTERRSYLHRACGDDQKLLRRLEDMLESVPAANSFMPGKAPLDSANGEIENYCLLHELGEGGCGVVYLAQQRLPLTRLVAIKVIKPGMDTRAVLARFEIERQALAVLKHPNIARVLEAGTGAGRPYFVMEYVEGIRITQYCDQGRLTVPERLTLFVQVCNAIQHAHYQGIIHRDIKPSNVLVTMHDGQPVAKVIDFGIAKALYGPLSTATAHTRNEHFIGTPEYVSPEQTDLLATDIDTRTDVYSLGVLLYELLTSQTPFHRDALLAAGFEGMKKIIQAEEPEHPSNLLSGLPSQQLSLTSASRSTSDRKLIRRIRGDLDWIVMRCLQKERHRRYQSANELARDIQRYLAHEPVLAGPPTVGYRVKKFARRHRLFFAATIASAAFVAILIGFSITTLAQAQRIAEERDRAERQRKIAEQVSGFMLNVFSAADPYDSQGAETTMTELLESAGKIIRQDISEPAVKSQLLGAIGRTYRERGDIDKAIAHLEPALAIRRQIAAASPEDLLPSIIDLGVAMRVRGDADRARELLDEGMKLCERYGLTRSDAYARVLLNLGIVELLVGQIPQSLDHLEKSRALVRDLRGAQSREMADVLTAFARTYQWLDRFEESERLAREAVQMYAKSVGPSHPDLLFAEVVLGDALYLLNRPDEASLFLERSLDRLRRTLGRDHRAVAEVLDGLSHVRLSQSRLEQAEQFARDALAVYSRARHEEHPETAFYRTRLATVLHAGRKYDEAEAQARHALSTLLANGGPNQQYIASAEYTLAEVLLTKRKYHEAEALFWSSMVRLKQSGAQGWRWARSVSGFGETLFRQGRITDAERYLLDGYLGLAQARGVDRRARDLARERLSRFYMETGRPEAMKGVTPGPQSHRIAPSPMLGQLH